jgi:thioredoxin-related protein
MLLGAEISWAKDFNSGIEQAKKAKKPVVFIFSRHTCKYCVLLEETTFKDKQVIEMLNNNFISIISYTDENDYTPRDLLTPGTPAIWFLLSDGEPMYQPLMGAVDPENFLKALSIVKDEFQNSKK